jgi:nucleotide-binding universal stress UspA family protein
MRYRIVVGVDGSPHSEAALRWALEDAEARQGEVTALFAWQVPFLSIPGAYDRDELEATYKAYVNEIVSAVAPAPPVPLATVVAEGDPAASLIVASAQAELLVLGTRGRSPFAGLVLGSVSQRCAAAAHCPVVLIRVPGEKTSGQPAGG